MTSNTPSLRRRFLPISILLLIFSSIFLVAPVSAQDDLVCPNADGGSNFAGIIPVTLEADDVLTLNSAGGIGSVTVYFESLDNAGTDFDFNCEPGSQSFTPSQAGLHWIGYNGSGDPDSFTFSTGADASEFPFETNMIEENPSDLLDEPNGNPVVGMLSGEAITVTGISEDGAWYSIIDSVGNEGWVPASDVVLPNAPAEVGLCPDFPADTNFVEIQPVPLEAGDVISITVNTTTVGVIRDFTIYQGSLENEGEVTDFDCGVGTLLQPISEAGTYWIVFRGNINRDDADAEMGEMEMSFPFEANMIEENPSDLLDEPNGNPVVGMLSGENITVNGLSEDGAWYSIIDSVGNEGFVPVSDVVLPGESDMMTTCPGESEDTAFSRVIPLYVSEGETIDVDAEMGGVTDVTITHDVGDGTNTETFNLNCEPGNVSYAVPESGLYWLSYSGNGDPQEITSFSVGR